MERRMTREEAITVMQLYKDELEHRIAIAKIDYDPGAIDLYSIQLDAFDVAIEELSAEATCERCADRALCIMSAPDGKWKACKDYRPQVETVHKPDYSYEADMVKRLRQAEAVQGWIPCSERLPEIDETLHPCDQISEEVLGTDTYGNIRHVYLTKCGYLKPTFCTVEEGMSVDIVAWMPLPTPYKGGNEE